MVLAIEQDRRGTHLRLRKASTIARRALRPLAAATFLLMTLAASGQFIISDSPGLFTPSFRDLTNTDLGNSTFFGWGPSTGWGTSGNFRFDGTTDNDRIDLPPALQGVGGLTGTLQQLSDNTILAGSNNIYTAAFEDEYLRLQIPTNGTVGSGFTTIILQGHTAFGGFATNTTNDFDFPLLAGATPNVVVGVNAAGQGQFWAKYEIPGNAASYQLDFGLLTENVSMSELQVDTKWRNTSFAPDTATAIPEPSSAALFVTLGAFLIGRRPHAAR
jgi:hypothetical protein